MKEGELSLSSAFSLVRITQDRSRDFLFLSLVISSCVPRPPARQTGMMSVFSFTPGIAYAGGMVSAPDARTRPLIGNCRNKEVEGHLF